MTLSRNGAATPLGEWLDSFVNREPTSTDVLDMTLPKIEALVDEIRRLRTASSEKRTLDKPAKVGNGIFGVGVDERLVIERAQREYEYQHTPQAEAERMELFAQFLEQIHGSK